ncbi:MAG TPA: hypothetical protein VGJ28_25640, partial [Micromonosporaceae bacterium]
MQSRKFTITAMIVAAALTLTTAACNKSQPASGASGSTGGAVSLFGTDGIMSNSFGDTVKVPGELYGLSGTAALDPPNPAFDHAMLAKDPSLDDFSYAGQAYDAVMIL